MTRTHKTETLRSTSQDEFVDLTTVCLERKLENEQKERKKHLYHSSTILKLKLKVILNANIVAPYFLKKTM